MPSFGTRSPIARRDSTPCGRVVAVATVARHLGAAAQREAVAEVLAGPIGDARPFVAIAPLLSSTDLPIALEQAAALFPSRHSGARALRELLPRWAALGNVDDALARARALPDASAGERGIALGRIAPHSPSGGRDEIVREALESIATAPFSYGDLLTDRVAALADALVPLGELARLLALSDGTPALVALTRAAHGPERSRLLAELATRAGELGTVPAHVWEARKRPPA